MIELRDGSTVSDPRLNRIRQVDPRCADYPMAAVLDDQPVVSKTWNITKVLDQGQQGSCVGNGFTHELIADPFPHADLTETDARNIYFAAQHLDGQRGGEYPGAHPRYSGTSVLAGAKAVRKRGNYSAYHWTTDVTEAARAISGQGPVVIGVNWLTGMFNPDTDGFLNLTGKVEGGHCVCLIGVNVEDAYFVVRNSWGAGWGDGGNAKLRGEDLARLLDDGGECCLPTRIS